MFGMTSGKQTRFRVVGRAMDDAAARNLRRQAFALSKTTKESIITSPTPSEPGEPPTTRARRGKNLRGAIFTDTNPVSAVIGPRESWVGDVGEAHEFGIEREGDNFEERSFMGPALEESVDQLAPGMAGTIGL